MPPLDFAEHSTSSRPELPQDVLREIQERVLREKARVSEFGHVRETIHVPDFNGHRVVAVGNHLYRSKEWNFFGDFLFEFGLHRFGHDWFQEQGRMAPASQHPLYIWRRQAYDYAMRQPKRQDGGFWPNGALAACNNFYYDLYTVDNNGLLDDYLLARLRHRDQFQGAMHELFAEATCLRAGFTIIRENERDRTRRHVEFIAVHKPTGQHVLVEAKSRHRSGVMGQSGMRSTSADLKFRRLINDAITKDPHNPLALFVDTNLPPERAARFYEPESTNPVVPSKAISALTQSIRNDFGGLDPYNILIFSNHPQHYSVGDELSPTNRLAAFLSRSPRVPVHRVEPLRDLLKAATLYGKVPAHFPPSRG